jgi:hypothetical protein
MKLLNLIECRKIEFFKLEGSIIRLRNGFVHPRVRKITGGEGVRKWYMDKDYRRVVVGNTVLQLLR